MKVYIQKTQEKKDLKFKGTAGMLLASLKLNPESVIVTRNGELVMEDEKLDDKDTIEILQVVSGG